MSFCFFFFPDSQYLDIIYLFVLFIYAPHFFQNLIFSLFIDSSFVSLFYYHFSFIHTDLRPCQVANSSTFQISSVFRSFSAYIWYISKIVGWFFRFFFSICLYFAFLYDFFLIYLCISNFLFTLTIFDFFEFCWLSVFFFFFFFFFLIIFFFFFI